MKQREQFGVDSMIWWWDENNVFNIKFSIWEIEQYKETQGIYQAGLQHAVESEIRRVRTFN